MKTTDKIAKEATAKVIEIAAAHGFQMQKEREIFAAQDTSELTDIIADWLDEYMETPAAPQEAA